MNASSLRSRACMAITVGALLALMIFGAAQASAAYTITDFKLTPSTTQAGAHPATNYHVDPDASVAGSDDLKKLVLDFPAGLLGNPEAASPKCVATGTGAANKFASDACPASSYIGSMIIKWKEPLGNITSAPGSVYILSPVSSGSAATIGFVVRPQGWRKIFLKTEVGGIVTVRTGTDADYGLTLTVDNIPRVLTSNAGLTYPITLSDISVDINARAGGTSTTTPNGPYFAFNPTRCTPANTRATISSYSNVSIVKNSSFTPTGCSSVQFTPSASVTPTVTTPGAATGVSASFGVPTADAPTQQSEVKSIQTDLPTGTGLNMPAIGAVPALCTDAQLNADACPAGAKIGTVSAAVPFLPPTMTGDVYLLTRNSSITFGYVLRGANGVKAPLKGSAAAVDIDGDGGADLVRATAANMPQVPWSSATINFTSKLITNPANACTANTVKSTLTGWSGAVATLNNSWFGTVACAPDTTITAGPGNPSSTKTPTFQFTSSIAGSTFQCTLDNGAYAACVSPYTAAALTDGQHTFCVRAVASGQTDQSPDCRTWVVDTTPPVVTLSCTVADDGTTATCPWSNNDPTANVTCVRDNTPLGPPCPNPITVSGAGAHSVSVTATDPAGNAGTASKSFSIVPPPPIITITAPLNGSTTPKPTVNVTFTAIGAGGAFPDAIHCTVNGTPTTSSTTNIVALNIGANTISVICSDAYGSSSVATVVIIRSDTQPPAISGISISSGGILTYQATDDSGVPPSCNPPSGSLIPINGSGFTTVTITCVDAAGNVGTATYSVVIGPPLAVTITNGPPSVSSNLTPTFTWSANQPESGPLPCAPGVICVQVIVPYINYTCTMDNSSVACSGDSYTSPPLAFGQHQFCVTAHGVYSGQTSAPACQTFTIATDTPPAYSITSPAAGTSTAASSINVAYTVNGSTSIPADVTCTVNGAASTSTTTNNVNLVVGTNTITLICNKGQALGTPLTITVTRTPTAGFTPTFNQTLSSYTPGAGIDLHWSITHPAGAEPIRRIKVLEDPAISPNFAAYGALSDMCPKASSTTTTSFDVSMCPANARIGTVSINTETYASPLTGYAYLIGFDPIPRIGINVSAAIPGNPSGLATFQIVLVGSAPQVDPLCDPATDPNGYCATRISLVAGEIPNVGIMGITADFGGVTRGGLDPHPFVLDTYACDTASSLTTTAGFTGWSGATANITDSDLLNCPAQGPSISISSPTGPWTQSATATLLYSVDPGSGDTPTCSIPSGTSVPLNDGPNTITVSCTNSSGSTSASAHITRDNKAPIITIVSPVAGSYTPITPVQLSYTVIDDWDPAPICTPSPGPIALNQGANAISVTCTDHAGNTSTASRIVFFDNVVPVVTLNCTAPGSTSTCTFTVSEPATATCQVDGSSPAACASPWVTPPLTIDNTHTITVCATDPAGNTGCKSVIVGTSFGFVQITDYARPSASASSGATVTFASTGAAECSIDSGAYAACTSPWSIPTAGLASETEHTYDIRPVGGGNTQRGYLWIDNRAYGAQAAVTAQANSLTTAANSTAAGAHPNVSSTVTVQGYEDTQSLTVKFPDGLMGSLRSIPAASRCSAQIPSGGTVPQWQSGDCPLSSKIGTLSGLVSTSQQGTTSESGDVYLVDAAGIPSQYAAAVAIDVPDVGTGLGDIEAIGYLKIADAGRDVQLVAPNVPRTTSTGVLFHLRSGTLTIAGDTGGAANPLITNPHFCGPVNPNRSSADKFVGNGTSYEGSTLPTVTVSYPVTACSSLAFNPTITSSFSSLAAGSETALTTMVTMPADNATIRSAIVKLPSFISPNFPAFGTQTDQCSAGAYFGSSTGSYITSASAFGTATSAYREFTTANCPPQARMGTATISSPLVPGTLTADVYLISSSPIPALGIYVDPTKYGNPQGIQLGVFALSATPQIDPLCDPATDPSGSCPTQIQSTLSSLPDVPISSMSLTLGGMTGRALGANALTVATASDPQCSSAGENLISTFSSWASTVSQGRTQLILPTGCDQ